MIVISCLFILFLIEIYSCAFASISVFYHTSNSNLLKLTFINPYRESICIFLWGVTHFSIFLIWTQIFRICFQHNYDEDCKVESNHKKIDFLFFFFFYKNVIQRPLNTLRPFSLKSHVYSV